MKSPKFSRLRRANLLPKLKDPGCGLKPDFDNLRAAYVAHIARKTLNSLIDWGAAGAQKLKENRIRNAEIKSKT